MVMTSKIRSGKEYAESPVFFVKLKTDKIHLLIDYYSVNAIII